MCRCMAVHLCWCLFVEIYLFAIQLVCALGEYLIYAIWIAECDKAKAPAIERERDSE